MKKVIIASLFLFSCSKDYYIWEVYQGGVRIDERCADSCCGSYSSEGSYYKRTQAKCDPARFKANQ